MRKILNIKIDEQDFNKLLRRNKTLTLEKNMVFFNEDKNRSWSLFGYRGMKGINETKNRSWSLFGYRGMEETNETETQFRERLLAFSNDNGFLVEIGNIKKVVEE